MNLTFITFQALLVKEHLPTSDIYVMEDLASGHSKTNTNIQTLQVIHFINHKKKLELIILFHFSDYDLYPAEPKFKK